MKKLFIPILLFCLFVFPKNTFALSYEVDNTTYSVTDSESLRDYIYYTYVNDSTISNDLVFTMFYANVSVNGVQTPVYTVIIPNDSYLYQYSSTSVRFLNHTGSSGGNYYTGCASGSSVYRYFASDFSYYDSPSSCPNINLNNATINYHANIYESLSTSANILTSANYSYSDIVNKYSNTPIEPDEEEVNMFDVVSTFLIQFINIMPFIIPFILIMNLVCSMLFNERS